MKIDHGPSWRTKVWPITMVNFCVVVGCTNTVREKISWLKFCIFYDSQKIIRKIVFANIFSMKL